MENHTTLKIGCGKFIYGNGCIKELTKEILEYGKKPFFIGGPSSLNKIMDFLIPEFKNEELESSVHAHTGHCSKEWAKKYAALANENKCSVIVAVGGGKCIDLAKCTSVYAKLPIITVPTSIATCVATSAVCIMYDDNGIPDGSVAMEKEIDVCIADTDLIIAAPKRLLAAGIFDSMAKLPEVIHNTKINNYQDCTLSQYICVANSRVIYEYLTGEGLRAFHEGTSYKQFNDMILTNLIHTSVVSGFSSGSNQLALAHGLYDFMRRNFAKASSPYLHGEIVAVGIILQHAFNGESKEFLDEFKNLMTQMDLPTTLSEIGFGQSALSIEQLLDYLIHHTANHKKMHLDLLKNAIEAVL